MHPDKTNRLLTESVWPLLFYARTLRNLSYVVISFIDK